MFRFFFPKHFIFFFFEAFNTNYVFDQKDCKHVKNDEFCQVKLRPIPEVKVGFKILTLH